MELVQVVVLNTVVEALFARQLITELQRYEPKVASVFGEPSFEQVLIRLTPNRSSLTPNFQIQERIGNKNRVQLSHRTTADALCQRRYLIASPYLCTARGRNKGGKIAELVV